MVEWDRGMLALYWAGRWRIGGLEGWVGGKWVCTWEGSIGY